MPNGDPPEGFFYPTLTPIMDSYNATLFALHSKGHSEYNMVNIVLFIFVLEKTMMFAYLNMCGNNDNIACNYGNID